VGAGIARWSSAPRVARLPITLVQCDVLKPQELDAAFAEVDYVIHCAVASEDVIVRGTENVLRAAVRAGVKRVIHISSVAVYGGATGAVSETTTVPPGTLTGYGAAKLAAEQLSRDIRDLDVVILRPSIIYGPFSARWTVLNALRLKAGRWKRLDALGQGKCNLVHVHDVARFAIAAVQQDNVVGEVFNVNGPEIITWDDYMTRFNQRLGLSPMAPQTASRTHIKSSLVEPVRIIGKYALKHHAEKLLWLSHKNDRLRNLMRQTELTLKCTPNSDELSLFSLDATYRTDKVERLFGFRSRVDVDTGLGMSVAWLNHMGEPAM
jgi:nucleoside-diphosphate-sugar epimerase